MGSWLNPNSTNREFLDGALLPNSPSSVRNRSNHENHLLQTDFPVPLRPTSSKPVSRPRNESLKGSDYFRIADHTKTIDKATQMTHKQPITAQPGGSPVGLRLIIGIPSLRSGDML
jgi:predicted acylesterase/phospholipase RssA